MIFHNRFVSQDELTEFLSAADIYITPYLKPEQITSGTLAYAVGSGKAVISTPYWYAQRAARRRPRHPRAVARSAGDRRARSSTCSATTPSGSRMRRARRRLRPRHAAGRRWRARYVRQLRARARRARASGCAPSSRRKTLARAPARAARAQPRAPARCMTDDTGILQHAAFSVPRYDDGYCLDDNARALLLMTLVEDAGTEDVAGGARARVALPGLREPRLQRASAAASATSCRTRGAGPRSAARRTATGARCGRSAPSSAAPAHPGRQSLGGHLFHAALPAASSFTSPRAWAFTLLGIDEYLRAFQGDTQRAGGAQGARRAAARPVPAHERARLAVVRGPRRPTATRACRRRCSCRGARMEHEEMTRRRPALARLAASHASCSADGLLRADRLERLLPRAASARRASTSSRSRPAR